MADKISVLHKLCCSKRGQAEREKNHIFWPTVVSCKQYVSLRLDYPESFSQLHMFFEREERNFGRLGRGDLRE